MCSPSSGGSSSGGGGGSRKRKEKAAPAPKKPSVIKTKTGVVKTKTGVVNKQPVKAKPKVVAKGGKPMAEQKAASKKYNTVTVSKAPAAKITKVPFNKPKAQPKPQVKVPLKPKPKATIKPKVKAKGGKKMVEQKNITKGNNVATVAKAAAEKRAAPAKKVEKSLELNKKLFTSKYRNGDKPSYNQEYWAKKVADGVPQSEILAEQKKVGTKKAYSGDVVVTKDMQRKANDDLKRLTGSDATLQNGGVTKAEEKSGLLNERTKTTYQYKDKTSGKNGTQVITKATDPIIKTPLGDLKLGKKTSTTYVDGIEVATKTGRDPLGRGAKVTRPKTSGHVTDTVKVNEPTKTPEPTSAAPAKQATAGNGPAGATVQPDNLQNLLAIKKHKNRAGKRSTRNKGKGRGVGFGAGGVGLSIPT